MRNNWLIFIIGEWWTSLDPAEKSKFNNLASEYKEHLMREQPNFSYNKKQQQQVPINQSVNKSQLATNSVKPKGEGIGSVVNTPSYDHSNEKFVEKHVETFSKFILIAIRWLWVYVLQRLFKSIPILSVSDKS